MTNLSKVYSDIKIDGNWPIRVIYILIKYLILVWNTQNYNYTAEFWRKSRWYLIKSKDATEIEIKMKIKSKNNFTNSSCKWRK